MCSWRKLPTRVRLYPTLTTYFYCRLPFQYGILIFPLCIRGLRFASYSNLAYLCYS